MPSFWFISICSCPICCTFSSACAEIMCDKTTHKLLQVFSSCEECDLFLSIHKWEAKRRQSVKVEKSLPPSAHKEEQTKTNVCGFKQTGIQWMREIFWMNKNMGVETDRDFSCVLKEKGKWICFHYRLLNVATLISKKEICAQISHLKYCFFCIFSLTNKRKQVSILCKCDLFQFSGRSTADDSLHSQLSMIEKNTQWFRVTVSVGFLKNKNL